MVTTTLHIYLNKEIRSGHISEMLAHVPSGNDLVLEVHGPATRTTFKDVSSDAGADRDFAHVILHKGTVQSEKDAEGVSELIDAQKKRLSLDIDLTMLGPSTLPPLLSSLLSEAQHGDRLEALQITLPYMDVDVATSLAGLALHTPMLQQLDLHINDAITTDTGILWKTLSRYGRLQSFHLYTKGTFTAEVARSVTSELKVPHLRSFVLSADHVVPAAMTLVGGWLMRCKELSSLAFLDFTMTPEVDLALVESLKGCKAIDMFTIGASTCPESPLLDALAIGMIPVKLLTFTFKKGTSQPMSFYQELGKVLSVSRNEFHFLIINNGRLGTQELDFLGMGIAQNGTVDTLSLSDCDLSRSGLARMAAHLSSQGNKTLRFLDILGLEDKDQEGVQKIFRDTYVNVIVK